MTRSGRFGRMVLAIGLVAVGTTHPSLGLADDHRGKDEHARRDEHGDRHERGDRDDHGDRGRYAGRDWNRGEHREHRGRGWGVRPFPFGWGGGPPIGLPLPRPIAPVPGYGTPYDNGGTYTPFGPEYDDNSWGGYGYGRRDPYTPQPGYGW